MQRITYINSDGRAIVFGMSPPFLQGHISGVGELESEIQLVRAAGLDGALDYGATLTQREISVEGTLLSHTGREALYRLKEDAALTLNPKKSGVLVYENNHGKWHIPARPIRLPVYGVRRKDMLPYIVYFVCPSPFWEDIDETVLEMGHGAGGLRFPLRLPFRLSTTYPERVASNTGHVSTPVRITFSGPAVNPSVTNATTDMSILVENTVPEGATLFINTDIRDTTVEIRYPGGTREDATGWLSLGSDFFQLEPGDNLLRYHTDNADARNRLTVSYRRRYIGV